MWHHNLFGANHSPVYNVHKYDVETWSLQSTYTETGLFSEEEDS